MIGTKPKEPDYFALMKKFEADPQNAEIVKRVNQFMSYDSMTVAKVRAEWDSYYERCRGTEAYDNYAIMEDAFKMRDLKTIRDVAQRARELRAIGDFLPQPKSVDPTWFFINQGSQTYRWLLRKASEQRRVGSGTGIFSGGLL